MKLRQSFVLCAMGVGLGLLAAACGSGSSSVSPSASVPATSSGATIQGTLQSGSAGTSAGPRVLSETQGIRVSVVGMSLSSTTDSAGHFVLTGVPSGRAELRFQGPGIDARLEVSGLAEGQTLTITVRVAGSQASLVPDDESEVEFHGAVEATAPTLRIAGRTVRTDKDTRVLGRDDAPLSPATLKIGDQVEVEGVTQADGSILARTIKLEDESDDDEDQDQEDQGEVEFTGRIQTLSPFMVAGRDVVVGPSTRILDHRGNPIRFEALKIGDNVEVKGRPQNSSVLAEKIKVED